MRKNRRYQKNWPENPHGEGLAEFWDGEGDDDLPPELPSSPPPPSFPSRADWDGGSLYSNEAGGSYLGNTPSESVSLNSESVSSLDHLGYHNNYNTNRPDSRYVRRRDKFDSESITSVLFNSTHLLFSIFFSAFALQIVFWVEKLSGYFFLPF